MDNLLNKRDNYKKIWLWSVAATVLLAGLLRCRFLNASLEYDEIWSWEYFAALPVSQLLMDFSLPNNHPLNTIFLKYFFDAENLWLGRMATFIAGILSIPLAGMLAKRMFGMKTAILTMVLCTVSPQLIRYGYPARGYGMQLFFILLFCYSSLFAGSQNRIYPFVMLVSGLLAVNTVSTSLIFLFIPGVLCGIKCLKNLHRKEYQLWLLCLGGFALYCLAFVYVNYYTLQSAKEYGEILSLQSYPVWLGKTVWSAWIYAGVLFFAVKPDKKTISLFSFIIFPLLLAYFTNGSPPRVWLAATVASVIIASRGILLLPRVMKCKKKMAVSLTAGVLALCLLFLSGNRAEWKHIEWQGMYNELKTVPADTAVIYGANEGYPILWNSRKDAADDYLNRVMYPGGYRKLLMVNCGNHIDGLDAKFNVIRKKTNRKPLVVKGKYFTGDLYDLLPVNGNEINGGWLIAMVRPLPSEEIDKIVELCQKTHPGTLKLNVWLGFTGLYQNKPMRFGMFAFQKNAHSGKFFDFVRNYFPAVTIYALGSPSEIKK